MRGIGTNAKERSFRRGRCFLNCLCPHTTCFFELTGMKARQQLLRSFVFGCVYNPKAAFTGLNWFTVLGISIPIFKNVD